MEAEQGGLRRI